MSRLSKLSKLSRLSRRCSVPLLACWLLVPAVAATDRLVFESGGTILVDRWWEEGDWLRYESQGGTIGIPRSTVVRIERDVSSDPSLPAAPRRSPRRPPVRTDELLEELVAAKASLERRDFEAASSAYFRVLLKDARFTGARVGYVIAEMALGRDGIAISAAREGLVYAPEEPQLLELLGDLRYREERVEDALESWRAALAVKPSDSLQQKILKGERDLQTSGGYDFAATPHFNVLYDGDVDLGLAAAAMDFLEEQYWVLVGRLDHAPQQPITVMLYPERQFREATGAAEGVGGLYDGKIRVPLGGLRKLDQRARRVLIHELTHAVIHSKTRGNCPRWLHEGMAQRLDGSTLGTLEQEVVAEMLRNGGVPSWEMDGFSYPAALSLCRHLESLRGFDGMVDLLDRLGRGDELEEAMLRVFGEGLENVQRRWLHSARRAEEQP